MANFANPSLRELFNYDGNLPEGAKNCQGVDQKTSSYDSLIDVPCTQVCNDSQLLIGLPNPNLVTCGQWSFLMNGGAQLGFQDASYLTDALGAFESVGLYAFSNNAAGDAIVYADLISTCLLTIYKTAKAYSSSDGGIVAAACTTSELFATDVFAAVSPVSASAFIAPIIFPMASALKRCLDAMCSPRTLDTDLAGIGVFSSFIIQSIIAIMATIVLSSIGSWPLLRIETKKPHIEALVTALIDFHKAQCYFSSTVQITALILFRQTQSANSYDKYHHSNLGPSADLLDGLVLVVLATCGLIPMAPTLACVSRYGRQSWYLIILSLVTFVLATAALASATRFEADIAPEDNDFKSYNFESSIKCPLGPNWVDNISSLCGSSDLRRNELGKHARAEKWTWVVWLCCMLVLLLCVTKKVLQDLRCDSYLTARVWAMFRRKTVRRISILAVSLLWSACFGAQFYLFGLYFGRSLISSTWSFGQIIAVVVRIPSLVEYAYITYNGIEAASKYWYPSPLKVMKAVVYQSIQLATFDPLQQPSQSVSTAPV